MSYFYSAQVSSSSCASLTQEEIEILVKPRSRSMTRDNMWRVSWQPWLRISQTLDDSDRSRPWCADGEINSLGCYARCALTRQGRTRRTSVSLEALNCLKMATWTRLNTNELLWTKLHQKSIQFIPKCVHAAACGARALGRSCGVSINRCGSWNTKVCRPNSYSYHKSIIFQYIPNIVKSYKVILVILKLGIQTFTWSTLLLQGFCPAIVATLEASNGCQRATCVLERLEDPTRTVHSASS